MGGRYICWGLLCAKWKNSTKGIHILQRPLACGDDIPQLVLDLENARTGAYGEPGPNERQIFCEPVARPDEAGLDDGELKYWSRESAYVMRGSCVMNRR